MIQSHLTSKIATALQSAQGKDVHHSDVAGFTVWGMKYPSLFASESSRRKDVVDQCKREILNAMIVADTAVYFVPPDDPIAEKIPGLWRRAGESAWYLPPDLNLDESHTNWFIALGNWQLYTAAVPIEDGWPDPARVPVHELVTWMNGRGVDVLVDSFHDDVSWIVGLRNGEPRGVDA